MLDRRPLFYAALPIATLVAMRLRPTVTLWALTLFAVPFVTHSLISPKAERYVFYVLPFFFVAWGIAGAAGLRALYAAAVAVIPTSAPRRLASVATVAVLIFPAVYLLGHEYRTAAQLFAGKVHYTPYREPDWAVAAARVAPAIAEAEFIIGSSGPDELYHLGRCDAFLNVSAVAKNGEFALTDRLGRPAISTPESLARLVHEHPSGLVFVARSDWRDPTHVTDAAADYLETNLERVPDPARDVMMFRWPKPTVENRR